MPSHLIYLITITSHNIHFLYFTWNFNIEFQTPSYVETGWITNLVLFFTFFLVWCDCVEIVKFMAWGELLAVLELLEFGDCYERVNEQEEMGTCLWFFGMQVEWNSWPIEEKQHMQRSRLCLLARQSNLIDVLLVHHIHTLLQRPLSTLRIPQSWGALSECDRLSTWVLLTTYHSLPPSLSGKISALTLLISIIFRSVGFPFGLAEYLRLVFHRGRFNKSPKILQQPMDFLLTFSTETQKFIIFTTFRVVRHLQEFKRLQTQISTSGLV